MKVCLLKEVWIYNFSSFLLAMFMRELNRNLVVDPFPSNKIYIGSCCITNDFNHHNLETSYRLMSHELGVVHVQLPHDSSKLPKVLQNLLSWVIVTITVVHISKLQIVISIINRGS